jgi:hypothetical protein
LGRGDAAPGEEWFVTYLPGQDSAHRFVPVPPRAATLYQAVGAGCPRSELAERLRILGHPGETPEDPALLALLGKCRALDIPG